MSQPTGNAPSVVVNAAGNRQQVPLRDYLNARVAPFLKKAITESLDVEAEFPLQWLGECLIHQSILYEGNPDRTNIRERFVNKFEDPKPQEQPASEPQPTLEATSSEPPSAPSAAPDLTSSNSHQDSEVTMNEVSSTETPAIPPSLETAAVLDIVQPQPFINGVKEESKSNVQSPARDDDTEMGGIS